MRWIALLALGLLSGCVSLPQFDPDLACNLPSTNEAQAMAEIRSESVALTGVEFVGGNTVHLLENGPQTYAAMQAAIMGATRRIDMESYEFDGQVAERFADLLIARAKAGVQVSLVYDDFGTNAPPGLFARMRQGGVRVVTYSPFDPLKMTSLDLNKRDHRKLLLIDGDIAFTGGINIAEVYENHRSSYQIGDNPKSLPWRDTDVEITGPVVGSFEPLFMQVWVGQHGPAIIPPPPPSGVVQGDSVVQALDGSPLDGHPAIYKTLLVAIAAARHSVHLTTGFFAPPPDLRDALECAARRGVDVRVIVPSESTSDTTIAAGRANYTRLLRAGVKIYERQGAVLHAKTAVIDGQWSVVGSANLDWRSVVFNNEIDAVVLGRHFGAEMEAQFSRDLLASHEITRAQWRRRGLGERWDEIRARMVEVLL